MLVFAGGPIMGVRALADIEAIFERAASRGVPCIIAGCGFGPLESGIHKRSARRILALCKAMVWRDEQSLAYAQKLLGREMNALVAEDPAFTWLSRLVPPGHKRDRSIVLGLRDWPSHQYASALGARAAKRLQRQSEAAILDALMAAIERDSSLSLLPLPMCTNHAGGDDRWYLRELLRRQPSLLERVDQAFLTQEVAPEVVAHAVWTANAAIAMRYHALVFAIGTGTPAVALDYTLGKGKVAALARRFDIPVSAFTDVSVEWLHDQLSKALTGDSVRPNPLTPTFKAVLRELLDAS
jgi:polysaccharide pyruvyl transferase WcaK-like protein